MQAGIVSSVSEIEMLSNASPDGVCLANIDAHSPVQTEHAIKIDTSSLVPEVATHRFQRIETPSALEIFPDMRSDTAKAEFFETRVTLDPFAVSSIIL
jgi:hypothetical protein